MKLFVTIIVLCLMLCGCRTSSDTQEEYVTREEVSEIVDNAVEQKIQKINKGDAMDESSSRESDVALKEYDYNIVFNPDVSLDPALYDTIGDYEYIEVGHAPIEGDNGEDCQCTYVCHNQTNKKIKEISVLFHTEKDAPLVVLKEIDPGAEMKFVFLISSGTDMDYISIESIEYEE